MVWPLFNFVGRNLSNFCVGLLKNFQHQKFILKLSDLYNCHLVKKQFSDVEKYATWEFILPPYFCFIAVPWIFLPTSKSFLSKYLQRKLFDGMIFHTMFDQLEMDEKIQWKNCQLFWHLIDLLNFASCQD